MVEKIAKRLVIVGLSALLAVTNALALEPAEGEVLLIISGSIVHGNAERNGEPVAEFDRAMLESMPLTTVTTKTPWTPNGPDEFTGVRFNELLAKTGVVADEVVIRAEAEDNYWFDLEKLNSQTYPIIVAFQKNGKPMSIRELGPLWIIFPWDEYPELLTKKNNASSVWQLTHLIVQ